MSQVTNIILTVGGGRHEKIEEAVNEYFGFDTLRFIDSAQGGTKLMECDLMLGGMNKLDMSEFCEHLASIDWRKDLGVWSVQLLAMTEEDNQFHVAYTWGVQ